MKSNYPWLQKNQERDKRNTKREIQAARDSLAVMGGAPLSARFTGHGDDGELQANRPTHLLRTNVGDRTVHEGEQLNVRPDGSFDVIPAHEMGGQQALQRHEQQQNIPGYQIGTAIGRAGRQVAERGQKAVETVGSPLRKTMQQTYTPVSGIPSQTAVSPGGATGTPNVITRETVRPPEDITVFPQTTATSQTIDREVQTPEREAAVPRETPGSFTYDVAKGDPTKPVSQIAEPPPIQETKPPPSPLGSDISRVRDYAAGRSPFEAGLREAERERFKGEETAARGALEQQMSQAGLTEREAMTERAMLSRGIGAQEVRMMTELRRMEGDRAYNAALALPGLQHMADEFALREREYSDTAEWKEFLNAAEYGDDATVKAAYEKVFGRAMEDDAMINDIRSYTRNKRAQDLTMSALNIENQETANKAAELGLSASVYDEALRRISTGGTPEQVRDFLLRSGVSPMNLDVAYDSIRDASVLGDRDWGRKMASVEMLLSTPDATGNNLRQATTILNDSFPGLGINFDTLITEQNAALFNKGMSQMNTYVNDFGMDFDKAASLMEKDGTLEYLGLDKDGAEKLFGAMRVNAIDDTWDVVNSSEWYAGLDPEQQEDIQFIFDETITGNSMLGVAEQYDFYDKDDKLVKTQYFVDEADAEKFATENGYSSKATGKKSVVLKDTTTGEMITGEEEGGKERTAYESFYDMEVPSGTEIPVTPEYYAMANPEGKEGFSWSDYSKWYEGEGKHIQNLTEAMETPSGLVDETGKVVLDKGALTNVVDLYKQGKLPEQIASQMFEAQTLDRIPMNFQPFTQTKSGTGARRVTASPELVSFLNSNRGKTYAMGPNQHVILTGNYRTTPSQGLIEVYNITTGQTEYIKAEFKGQRFSRKKGGSYNSYEWTHNGNRLVDTEFEYLL